MKVYLVGGAVRDQYLGLTVKERDWVVVGASPQQMLELGFQKVGRDFPIYLDPEHHEEYALARTERKTGYGYYGFSCDANPTVTLEEDLLRRDLTINAMALDTHGHLVDPYGGMSDLNARILRHVSPAFVEDPVRVLRVARFMARFHRLGFKIADETRLLMYDMVRRGELEHLVPERVWQEWQKSLHEKNPELFLCTLRACGALKVILPELDRLFGVPNKRHYHSEVDSGVHTLMVLSIASQITLDPLVRFAACVHDLGKSCTPMQHWPAQTNHEALGVQVIEHLCQRLRIPNTYRKLAILASRFHLNIHRLAELRPATIINVLEQTQAFRQPSQFEQLLKVCEADAKGRGDTGEFPNIPWYFPGVTLNSAKVVNDNNYPQAEQWRQIVHECAKITPKDLIAQGYQGEAIKLGLQKLKIDCVERWKQGEK